LGGYVETFVDRNPKSCSASKQYITGIFEADVPFLKMKKLQKLVEKKSIILQSPATG
jgi:hypothetical protein